MFNSLNFFLKIEIKYSVVYGTERKGPVWDNSIWHLVSAKTTPDIYFLFNIGAEYKQSMPCRVPN